MSEPTNQSMERRPIQSRNTRWAASATQFLVNRNLSPNTISLLGMVAAVAAGMAFYSTSLTGNATQRVLWFCGGALCQMRLLCNLFDGMVAVQRNIASRKGELFNEVPDRVSDAAVFIGLGYSAGGDVALGYLAALLAIFVAYVRAVATSIGAPNDFCGPMAKPQRMALVTLASLFLVFSPDSWRLPWGEVKVVLVLVILGGIVTALRRLGRAANHLGKIGK
ncbi:MAG: CDP-alcohol phosphatidyltransferase family protein [Planctomycetes bacterium]|nr:CDP-alcohol phosphatidyltransferase family protein [Planctomycetota bacterium]